MAEKQALCSGEQWWMSCIMISTEEKSAARRQGREHPALRETTPGSQAVGSAAERSKMSCGGGEGWAPFWLWDTSVVSNTCDCSTQRIWGFACKADASCNCTKGSCRDEKVFCHLNLEKERKGWSCGNGYIMSRCQGKFPMMKGQWSIFLRKVMRSLSLGVLMQRFELTMTGLSWLVAGEELKATRHFLPALFTVILWLPSHHWRSTGGSASAADYNGAQ